MRLKLFPCEGHVTVRTDPRNAWIIKGVPVPEAEALTPRDEDGVLRLLAIHAHCTFNLLRGLSQ